MHIMLSKYSTSSYCLPSMVVLHLGFTNLDTVG